MSISLSRIYREMRHGLVRRVHFRVGQKRRKHTRTYVNNGTHNLVGKMGLAI